MVEGENDSSIYARLVSFDDGEGQVAGRYPFHQFLNQGIMESPRRCQNDNFLSKQKKIAFWDETVKNFPVLADEKNVISLVGLRVSDLYKPTNNSNEKIYIYVWRTDAL